MRALKIEQLDSAKRMEMLKNAELSLERERLSSLKKDVMSGLKSSNQPRPEDFANKSPIAVLEGDQNDNNATLDDILEMSKGETMFNNKYHSDRIQKENARQSVSRGRGSRGSSGRV